MTVRLATDASGRCERTVWRGYAKSNGAESIGRQVTTSVLMASCCQLFGSSRSDLAL